MTLDPKGLTVPTLAALLVIAGALGGLTNTAISALGFRGDAPADRLAAVERWQGAYEAQQLAKQAEQRDRDALIRFLADGMCVLVLTSPRGGADMVYFRRQCDNLTRRVP